MLVMLANHGATVGELDMARRQGRLRFALVGEEALEIHLDRTGFRTLLARLESLALTGEPQSLPVRRPGARDQEVKLIRRVTLHLDPAR
jgi:hypothetical protein